MLTKKIENVRKTKNMKRYKILPFFNFTFDLLNFPHIFYQINIKFPFYKNLWIIHIEHEQVPWSQYIFIVIPFYFILLLLFFYSIKLKSDLLNKIWWSLLQEPKSILLSQELPLFLANALIFYLSQSLKLREHELLHCDEASCCNTRTNILNEQKERSFGTIFSNDPKVNTANQI